MVLQECLLSLLLLVLTQCVENISRPLTCEVDLEEFDSILQDIESMGYTAIRGSFSAQLDATTLAANSGGGYISYSHPAQQQMHNLQHYEYKLQASSAVLYHGCTPPQSQYFGYTTMLYRDNGTLLWAQLDSNVLNHRVIHTYDEDSSSNHSNFDNHVTTITTADLATFEDIAAVYENHSIPESLLNLDIIPSHLITELGTSNSSSSFHTYLRVALPQSGDFLQRYFDTINNPTFSNLYFIVRNESYNDSYDDSFSPNEPEIALPLSEKRSRICNNASFAFSGDEYADSLHEAFTQLMTFTSEYMQEYRYYFVNETQIKPVEYDGFDCITNRSFCDASNSDVLYYEQYYKNESHSVNSTQVLESRLEVFNASDTTNATSITNSSAVTGFFLREDTMYMLIGVHHCNLGLASYMRQSIYRDVEFDVIGNSAQFELNNFELHNTAKYLSELAFTDGASDAIESDWFYAIMYARPGRCPRPLMEEGVVCRELGFEEVSADEGLVFWGTAVLNPCTNTGPSEQQFLYQWLLEFKYDEEEIDLEFGLIIGIAFGAVCCVISCIYCCMYFLNSKNDWFFSKYNSMTRPYTLTESGERVNERVSVNSGHAYGTVPGTEMIDMH